MKNEEKTIITREEIAGQLETLARQRQTALAQVQQIDGAIKMCRLWLAQFDDEEEEQGTVVVAVAAEEERAEN